MLRDPVQQTPEQDDAKVPRFGTPDREKHTKARHDGSAGTEGDHAGT